MKTKRTVVAVACAFALAVAMPVIAGSMSDSAKALAPTKIELNVTNLTSAEDKFGVNPVGLMKTSVMAIGHDKLGATISHMPTYTLTKFDTNAIDKSLGFATAKHDGKANYQVTQTMIASGKHGLGGNRDAEGSYSGHLLSTTSRSGHTGLAIGTA